MINEDPSVRSAIIKLFGSSAYAKGELDRKAISAIVFSDKTKLDAMTAIVRPALWRRFNAWKKPITAPYVLMEAATLIENGGQELVDHIVSVTAPEDVRIKRAMQRDGATEEQVRSRINNQTSEEERLKHAGSIIQNGGTPEELEAQAGDLMRYLNRLTLESEPIRGSSRH